MVTLIRSDKTRSYLCLSFYNPTSSSLLDNLSEYLDFISVARSAPKDISGVREPTIWISNVFEVPPPMFHLQYGSSICTCVQNCLFIFREIKKNKTADIKRKPWKNKTCHWEITKNQLCWCRLVYASAVVSKLEAHSIRVQINLGRYPFFKTLLDKAVWHSKKNIKTRVIFTKILLVWWWFGKIVFISSVFKKCEPAKRFFWGQRFRESSMRASVIRKAEKNGGNVQSRSELWR